MSLETITVDSACCYIIQYFLKSERLFPAPEKGECRMSAKDELLSYISTLTPEQVDKILSQLPRLTSLLEESSPLCPLGQTEQNQ